MAFFVPNINDEVPNPQLGKDVIAPLWTDLDAESGGIWTYEQATSGPLIDQANSEIWRMFPYDSFSASWVFVATWENVPLEFASFQVRVNTKWFSRLTSKHTILIKYSCSVRVHHFKLSWPRTVEASLSS